MLLVALAIVLAPLAWLVIKRMQHADEPARGGRFGWVIACLGAALALRAGLALDEPARKRYAAAAERLLEPYRDEELRRRVADEVLPVLLRG